MISVVLDDQISYESSESARLNQLTVGFNQEYELVEFNLEIK